MSYWEWVGREINQNWRITNGDEKGNSGIDLRSVGGGRGGGGEGGGFVVRLHIFATYEWRPNVVQANLPRITEAITSSDLSASLRIIIWFGLVVGCTKKGRQTVKRALLLSASSAKFVHTSTYWLAKWRPAETGSHKNCRSTFVGGRGKGSAGRSALMDWAYRKPHWDK